MRRYTNPREQPVSGLGPTYKSGEVTLESALEGILPAQERFLSAQESFVDYIGGQGAGKTVALCALAILNGNIEPGGMSLIGRSTVPALRDTTQKTFLEMIPAAWVREYKEGNQNRLIHVNGHEYIFRHLDLSDPEIKAHIRSLNLSAFYVDEASEIKKETFFTLVGRLRRRGVRRRIGRLGSNAAGHDWQWETFFKEERDPISKRKFVGVLASTTDNRHLPEDYLENMLALYPADWQERFIHASFADFTDKVFKDYDPLVHVWDARCGHLVFGGRQDPPLDWPVIVGIDIGGVDPWAWAFIAIQPETGFLFQFAEIYAAGILVKDLMAQYESIMQGRRLDAMAYDYENKQAALELAELGLGGAPAQKEVMGGIMKVGEFLHPDIRLINPFTGLSGAPRYYLSSDCRNAQRELMGYSWAKDRQGNPTGKPAHFDSHSPDSIRYCIHTFRPSPKEKPKPRKWQNPELDELSRMYWRDLELAEQRMKKKRGGQVFTYRQAMRH